MLDKDKKYLGQAYLFGIPLWKVNLSKEKWEKALVSSKSLKGYVFYYKLNNF